METLVSDCFPPIFSYLSLADLLNFRTVSRRMKQEVEDYLPNVRSLPLYLTTLRTPEQIVKYENCCLLLKERFTSIDGIDYTDLLSFDDLCFRRLPFGTSGLGTFEDLTILQNQSHFQRSDFLILKHSSALLKFLSFIKKNCPNIEKLALVMDHCDHYLPEVSKVLEAFSAIKVLLLERTMQDSCRHYSDRFDVRINESHPDMIIFELQSNERNWVELPPEVYNSILALGRLEELFLFPKRQCQFLIESLTESQERNFVRSLLERLRVFHMNSKRLSFPLPVDKESYELLEELACPSDLWLRTDRLALPSLKKLILLRDRHSLTSEYSPLPRPSLKVLDISADDLRISLNSIQNLNNFTGLESILCRSIEIEIVHGDMKNWTIKHLQVMRGPKTAEMRNEEVRWWSKYFVALETCTFLEPEYSVVRVSDLRNGDSNN